MTKAVAIIHGDPEFQLAASVALRKAGCDVVSYISSMTALNDIKARHHVDVLVTSPTASLILLDGILTHLSATRTSQENVRQSPCEADAQRCD